MLTGWKTVIVGGAIAVLPTLVDYLGGVDWTQYVSPNVAAFITGVVMVGLRAVTSTPIFKK